MYKNRMRQWPVLPDRGIAPDGSEIKFLVIPMPGGSMVCDEMGRPFGMRKPGTTVTSEETAILMFRMNHEDRGNQIL